MVKPMESLLPSGVAHSAIFSNRFMINTKLIRNEIDYIVTHGTGTKLGDPVEINALFDAFKKYTKKQLLRPNVNEDQFWSYLRRLGSGQSHQSGASPSS